MKVVEYMESCSTQNSIPEYYHYSYPNARLLFFDIETTGFAAKNTTLYLIGALWYENNTIKMKQWFNENGQSENDMLTAFNQFCENFTHLVHFNGNGFDLPYLNQKAAMQNITFEAVNNMTQIDIYKEIRSYKKIFSIDNLKQVSIEKFLGIKRKDIYSGGDLVPIYQKYVAKPSQEMEDILLLHNHDDLLGMIPISQILNYKNFFERPEIISIEAKTEQDNLILTFTCGKAAYLPRRISLTHNEIYLNALGEKASLHIPIFTGTLKHYFKDYKNYYYLPKEDMAIHKSVAAFVDPENKEKATKSTCYMKKTDQYIPYMSGIPTDLFQREFSEKESFQTLNSVQNNPAVQADYIRQILHSFI